MQKPEYRESLASWARDGKEPLTEGAILALESDPRYRPSLVNNRSYRDFLLIHGCVEVLYEKARNDPNQFQLKGTSCLGAPDLNQERIREFRRTVYLLNRFLEEDAVQAEKLRMSDEEESQPEFYPFCPLTKPTSKAIKRAILYELKMAGYGGLKIKELSERAGLPQRIISSWISNHLHQTPKIERMSYGKYVYCPQSQADLILGDAERL